MIGNPENVKLQFDYLKKLKKMKIGKLRKEHREVMNQTKWADVKIVKPYRALLERRLFIFFCLCHYHYPKGSTPRLTFFRKAKKELAKPFNPLPPPQEEKRRRKEQYKQTILFTKRNINEMHINQVDKYLAEFSIYVDIRNRDKRKLLWEYHRLPTSMLAKTLNEAGEVVYPRRLGALRMQNKWVLRDLICENPTMTYGQFTERYGDKMPNVSRASFKVTRSQLKTAGYELPDLRGQAQAVIKNGRKTKRGEALKSQD